MAIYLNNFAGNCAGMEHYVRAEEYYNKALHILEKAHGPDHPDVLAVLRNLLALYRQTGNGEKASTIEKRLGIDSEGTD